MLVPFNKLYTASRSASNIKDLIDYPERIYSGFYTKKCIAHFESLYPEYEALMTTSCTAALELIALALDFSKGEEIIMPSYNFVGVANAFALHGAKIVFADIEPHSMNIQAASIESAITKNTKAVLVMHYGGAPCEIEAIRKLCDIHHLILIEDNAQGIGVTHNGRLLGSFGDFSTISFDSQKNISCSEGGLILYKKKFKERIITVFNNGTNKAAFMQGLTPNFEWISEGLKFNMSEYNAAILSALLDEQQHILQERMERWNALFETLEQGWLPNDFLPHHLKNGIHNAHLFYVKCRQTIERDALIAYLSAKGISTQFHYMPLHHSTFAREKGFVMKDDQYTTMEAQKLLRLPIYNALSDDEIQYMSASIHAFYQQS
ncbi:MAG: aminotransferase class I/II-fold pyridoxal phosphate-dependent enzyme [Chitinophagales bacterium]|nr:aminotransferase class I/II-fold pyridoxal phosphate-dependent enzyme [Chitinophagales bacterium]